MRAQCRSCIPQTCRVINFFLTLRQSCGNVPMWSWIAHIWCSSQSWHKLQCHNIDVEKTWIWRRGFNVVSSLSLQHPWYSVRWTYYPTLRQRWHNIVNLTSQFRTCEDIVNLTSRFRCCSNVFDTALILYCELNSLSIIKAMLEQRFNFDLVVSKLLQRCVLVERRYDLTTTLCVFAEILLAFAIFFPRGFQILMLKNC